MYREERNGTLTEHRRNTDGTAAAAKVGPSSHHRRSIRAHVTPDGTKQSADHFANSEANSNRLDASAEVSGFGRGVLVGISPMLQRTPLLQRLPTSPATHSDAHHHRHLSVASPSLTAASPVAEISASSELDPVREGEAPMCRGSAATVRRYDSHGRADERRDDAVARPHHS